MTTDNYVNNLFEMREDYTVRLTSCKCNRICDECKILAQEIMKLDYEIHKAKQKPDDEWS